MTLSRLFGIVAVLICVGCTAPRSDVPRPISYAIDDPQDTALGRLLAPWSASDPGRSGFHFLVTGHDAFLARAALAESAQRSLDLQYYIVAEDASAALLLYRAARAAQRGVRVRLLIDDMYALGKDFDLATLSAHPNVEVRVFNPFLRRGTLGISQLLEYLGDADRLNRRMHNKLWIADNAAAVIGGRNLGDAYFDLSESVNFADLDLLAAGPIVASVSRSFDEYWNSAVAVPIEAFLRERPEAKDVEQLMARLAHSADRFRESTYSRTLREADLGRLLRSGQLQLVRAPAVAVYSPPFEAIQPARAAPEGITAVLRNTVESASHEVILISPYFIPSDRGVRLLCELAARKVLVRVLTNSLASTDVPVVHAGYARYRPRLLACGVALHELRPNIERPAGSRPGLSSGASLHAKAVVVDRKRVLVGSMNLDPRSRLLNTEVAVLIDSDVLGRELGTMFDAAVMPDQAFNVALSQPGNVESPLSWHGAEQGRSVRYDREPFASWWRRFIAGVFGRLAPEELL